MSDKTNIADPRVAIGANRQATRLVVSGVGSWELGVPVSFDYDDKHLACVITYSNGWKVIITGDSTTFTGPSA